MRGCWIQPGRGGWARIRCLYFKERVATLIRHRHGCRDTVESWREAHWRGSFTERYGFAANISSPIGGTMATDLERFVEADGREEQIAEVEARIEAGRHQVPVLPVRLGDGADHGQGHTGQALRHDRPQGLPARVRLHRQPLHRSPRQLHRLRPRGPRAGRHRRAGDVHAPALGPENGPGVVHAVQGPRGGSGWWRLPHVGLPRQPPAASR